MSADWEIVVGLETHAQLSTRAKIFSGAATAFGAHMLRSETAAMAAGAILVALRNGLVSSNN